MTLASSTFFLLMWQIEINCGLIIHGKPDEAYLIDITKAISLSECEKKICNKDPKTCDVIAFSQEGLSCRRYRSIAPAILFWNQHAMISNESDFKTDVKISSEEKALTKNLPRPKILWLFDSILKGKNVVSTDSALDMDVSFITNWNYTGPHQNSDYKFLYIDTDTEYEKQVAAVHNKIRLISYKPAFTISVWIKMVVRDKAVTFFSCSGQCAYAYFAAGNEKIQYAPCGDSRCSWIYSTKKPEKKHEWRHISITQGPNAPTFFMNGEIWSIDKYSDKVYEEFSNLSDIKLRFGGSGGIHGSVACYMVFETQMSQEQIRSLMKLCP